MDEIVLNINNISEHECSSITSFSNGKFILAGQNEIDGSPCLVAVGDYHLVNNTNSSHLAIFDTTQPPLDIRSFLFGTLFGSLAGTTTVLALGYFINKALHNRDHHTSMREPRVIFSPTHPEGVEVESIKVD